MVTAEELSGFAGVVLSLALAYVPGWNNRYAQLNPENKRLLMLGLLLLASAAVFALACAGSDWDLLGLRLACDQRGLVGLLRALAAAVIANQAAFLLAPRPAARKLRPLHDRGGAG